MRPPAEAQRTSLAATRPQRLGASNQALLRRAPDAHPAGPKLKIGAVDDPLEREADDIADQMVGTPELAVPIQVSRKCAECEAEDELRREATGAAAAGEAPASVRDVLRSTGEPLDATTRAYFEPRFGRDFSTLRIHTDVSAEQSARDINARAYTAAGHIAFGAGQFAPSTQNGRRLIAHELAHAIQQTSQIRRMAFGQGNAPDILKEVPPEEQKLVLASIERVRKIAKNPKDFSSCHQSYAETCPGGNASSLEKAFDAALLWRFPHGARPGAGATTACGTNNIGYTDTGYGGGEEALAFDLLHELGHVCGISCPDVPHYFADKLALYCMGPQERDEQRQLSVGFGRSTEDWALVFSYGWLLHEWHAGRLGLRLNTDVNLLGALQGLKGLSGEPDATTGEIAGATFDLRARPFSGEHFGGLSLHAGLGGQLGRFRVRSPTGTDPPDIRTGAAFVVEVGSRIEWWAENTDAVDSEGTPGRVKPRALDFSYRLIHPVTPGAHQAHEFLASYMVFF